MRRRASGRAAPRARWRWSLAGGGHLVTGAPVRGALLLFGVAFCAFLVVFWPGRSRRRTRPPWPCPARSCWRRRLGLAIWALAVRDVFRRTREVGTVALKGTLKDFGIAEILQLIGQQQKSGVLHLKIAGRGDPRRACPRGASCPGRVRPGASQRELLGAMLVRAELISERELEQALEEQRRTLRRLGDILAEQGRSRARTCGR